MAHVTFIHGLSNKLAPASLLTLWQQALAANGGIDLEAAGVSSSMIYWADVMYAEPLPPGDPNARVAQGAETMPVDEDTRWLESLQGDERAFCQSLLQTTELAHSLHELHEPGVDDLPHPDSTDANSARIPLPWFLKRRLMKTLLRDVHHYLFNEEFSPRPNQTFRVKEELQRRFIDALNADRIASGDGPHIVISHSMGTLIAYDCLKCLPECPAVDGLITIGSPLGLDEVQDKLRPFWTRNNGFPNEKVRGDWCNLFDRLDPVAFDAALANDFMLNGEKKIRDTKVTNSGAWRHGISQYMSRDGVRDTIRTMLGLTV